MVVEASSAPAHRRGASQPRSAPVFTGAPSGSSTDEGGYLAYPVPGSPRAGPPQGSPNAALESRKDGSDQGVDISPTPDTRHRPRASRQVSIRHRRVTLGTNDRNLRTVHRENKSEPDQESTVVETDASQDDMPHDPPSGSLPNDTCSEAQHPTPHAFHPSHRRTGRRVVTAFSGYDGFREAAAVAGSIWQAIAGCEDIHQNRKARVIAALWDDVNPHGKIVGDYADLIGRLESGTLFFGSVDLWAITPPCWDHCAVNKQRAGDNGKAGALIGDAVRLISAIRKRHALRGIIREDVPSVADFESFKKLTANLAEPELGLASTWAFVDVWRLGSPTRRKRVAVVAISTEALRNDELETPLSATIAWRRHNSHRTQHQRCCHRTPSRANCASTPNSTNNCRRITPSHRSHRSR